MSIGDFKEMVSAQLAAQRRATPPSPSTAPEVDENGLIPMQALHDVIEPYAHSIIKRGFSKEEQDKRLHDIATWIEACFDRAALASRPVEVDDEGLPPLPKKRGTIYQGNYWTDCDEADPPGVPLADVYTAEQYRQGQRDAVAADRARRGEGEERFYPQLFLNWNRSQENPPVAIGKEMGVARKAVELSKAAPSHTTNKENG